MGESKRRKESIGDEYGKEQRIVAWLPITKTQSEDFVKWTSRGSWIGISLLVAWGGFGLGAGAGRGCGGVVGRGGAVGGGVGGGWGGGGGGRGGGSGGGD